MEAKLPPGCKLVLLVLASFMGELTRMPWVPFSVLAAYSGLTEEQCKKGFKQAVDAGFVQRKRTKGDIMYECCIPEGAWKRVPIQRSRHEVVEVEDWGEVEALVNG